MFSFRFRTPHISASTMKMRTNCGVSVLYNGDKFSFDVCMCARTCAHASTAVAWVHWIGCLSINRRLACAIFEHVGKLPNSKMQHYTDTDTEPSNNVIVILMFANFLLKTENQFDMADCVCVCAHSSANFWGVESESLQMEQKPTFITYTHTHIVCSSQFVAAISPSFACKSMSELNCSCYLLRASIIISAIRSLCRSVSLSLSLALSLLVCDNRKIVFISCWFRTLKTTHHILQFSDTISKSVAQLAAVMAAAAPATATMTATMTTMNISASSIDNFE